ncbi:TIGR01777 family oxidoreductase [Riemerella columbipharyngis]|uniref:TIGR01777 family protein n=1 Tax=Riemerella columbipharyngis TaxID=1071918 RepID=A0A1G6YB41_9FLAO|nr:TIGR01777 family oxidoreductase [Riemerella columbipharyngis]SDD87629.1 hypothetical protein SAMN05421544_10196 [Riemerella columbipharyngis]
MKVVLAGGTGFVGSRLTEMLIERGHEILMLTRSLENKKNTDKITYYEWTPSLLSCDVEPFLVADAVVNLAGAGIADERWTPERKRELMNSRVSSNRTIVKMLRKVENKVKQVVCTSAIGWYGYQPDNSKKLTEDLPHAADFLARLCYEWEESARRIEKMNKKLSIIRTGIVLGKGGGVYPQMTKSMNFGVMGIAGDGNQKMSWIHLDDHCRVYIHLLENEIEGIFNSVSPNVVTQEQFLVKVKEVKGRFCIPIKTPKFILKTIFGDLAEMILSSAVISCEKIQSTGFKFRFNRLLEVVETIEKS